jgi:hypothetical protein
MRTTHLNKYLGILLFALAEFSVAGEVFTDFPLEIKAGEKHIIYSHGLIVEGNNERPIHQRFGAYEFSLIKAALVKDSEVNLIADHRPKNTDVATYVKKLSSWVRMLVSAEVEPGNITLLGFSRGGELTAYASSVLNDLNINTILLATCWPGSVQSNSKVTFAGNFLSVYETSDQALSCQRIADRSKELVSFKELSISTGKEHGAFFKPLDEWVVPVKQWINSKAVHKP